MGWFRARGRWATALALFALAVQLFASLGHVHTPTLKHAAIGAAAPASLSSDIGGGHSDDHDEDGDRLCGVCMTLHLVAIAQISAPPQLPVPAAFIAARQEPTESVAATLPCASFRSRAPPSV